MKKVIISILVGMIAMLGLCTTASAYYVGQSINVSYNDYKTNSNIYCVEHNQALKSSNAYTIISQVNIEGNKSTDHEGNTQTSWHNAKLAYILNASNGSNKDAGPVANSVWNYMYTWLKNVGKNHAGLYTSFSNGVAGNQTWLDTESSNYANSYTENTSEIKDNTNKENVKVVAYQRDEKSYMRVGPFNWTFPGTMQSVTADDQDGKNIEGLFFSSFNGNEEYWYGANQIQSGKDFYISMPMNTNITKITKITGNTKATVKGVNIWFLKAASSYKQNLIIREPYEAPLDITTSFDYDISTQGDLKVIKVNEDNHEIKLVGVGFKIQHKNTGEYVHRDENGKISYVKEDQATEFITDEKGEILVQNLVVGTYVAYETKNPNYGYEILTEGQEKEVVVNKTNECEIPNKQIYVKLSGYVWVDKIDGKQAEPNAFFKTPNEFLTDDKDILFNGVTVRLKDKKTEETIKETVTSKLDRYQDSVNDGNGEYLFMDVLIEKLPDYYIEFEYDGLTYTNVIPHIDQNRGSKAAEGEKERELFNQNFTTVEGNGRNTGFTRDAKGDEKHKLTYNIDENGHQATLINNGQYKIKANTEITEYSINKNFTYGQEEIQYINLGLYERAMPDIAIMKDLQNVRVAINGYEHTYLYAQRYVNSGEYGDGFNVGVKFGTKYGNMSYTRAIYKADYLYINEKDKSKELKVYVTYEIKMRNKSSSLITQVNSLVDYYDNNYKLVDAGTKLSDLGNIEESISHTENSYNNKYQKTTIETNTKIQPQKEATIYVQFELNKEAVLNILNNKANLDNVVEINSYSIYDDKDKIYAGIDINSNPGNAIPGDTRTYEDDTDASPALKLEVADARQIAGTVFLDETSGELMTGKIRQGDGIYEPGKEKGIAGVQVTLKENVADGEEYKVQTDENGNFLITDYIPGDYTLIYTWGDQTYTVQNYKGTIYDKNRKQDNKKWYKEGVETRQNDAIDNYQTRLEIDEEMQTVNYKTEGTITKTKMDASTPTMGIGVEYETTYTASAGDRYTYEIKNLDFGIVERPRQEIAISKRVKTMKATLANGQVIANITIEEDANGNRTITGEKKGITYMAPSPNTVPSNGFVKLELDNELIQGTTLEIGYEIKAINNSELDYLSENFYKYGILEGEVVTTSPTGIIDYLDKDWSFDQNKNPQWEIKTIDEIKNIVAEVVYNNEESTINEKTILYTDALKDSKLKPEESAQTMLNVSKILTTTDEISLDNETEITEINRPGGAKPHPTPGNYVPGKGPMEADDSIAETAIVTPSTGENQNMILTILMGTTALIILGVGIVVIKKKII